MELFKQEYWSELPFPPPGYLPNPGIKSTSLQSPALAGGFFTTSAAWEAPLPLKKHFTLKNNLSTHFFTHSLTLYGEIMDQMLD